MGCSTVYPENYSGTSPQWGTNDSDDDMCLIDDKADFAVGAPQRPSPTMLADDFTKVGLSVPYWMNASECA